MCNRSNILKQIQCWYYFLSPSEEVAVIYIKQSLDQFKRIFENYFFVVVAKRQFLTIISIFSQNIYF